MAPNITELRYVACWTEDDGIHWCACDHETIGAAMGCMPPDGRGFMRAWDNGVLRSLSDDELSIFISELKKIPNDGAKQKALPPLAASG